MKRRNPWFRLALSVLFLLLWTLPVEAGDEQNLKQSKSRLQEITRRLSQERRELKSAQGKERSLIADLERIEKKLSKGRKRLDKATRRVDETEHKLDQLASRITAQQMALEQSRVVLRSHMRLIYGMGSQGALKVALGQKSIPRMRQGMLYFSRLVRDRNRRFQAYRAGLSQLQSSQRKKADLLVQYQQQAATLSGEQREARRDRMERKRLLTRVRREKALHKKSVAELEKARKRLGEFIAKLAEAIKQDKFNRGPLMAPGERFGDISAKKGRLRAPVAGVRRSRPPGLFYRAAVESPVKAIFRGQVVYADWFRGYGQLIIMRHGDQLYTLYGHNSKLLVSQGDWVEEKETIAEVGDSGSLDGLSGLYFEVRHRGKAVNPRRWLR